MRLLALVLSALFLFSMSTGISANPFAQVSIAERVANQKSLRASVESSEGKFARLSGADKAGLLAAQDRIFEVLEGVPSEADLTATQRARLVTAESEVAIIVAKLDPSTAKPKVVCSYQARIGSNRKERVCKQVSSSDSSDARRTLQRMQTR